jgi:hypothetical protein
MRRRTMGVKEDLKMRKTGVKEKQASLWRLFERLLETMDEQTQLFREAFTVLAGYEAARQFRKMKVAFRQLKVVAAKNKREAKKVQRTAERVKALPEFLDKGGSGG